jgi:hypothetical protein
MAEIPVSEKKEKKIGEGFFKDCTKLSDVRDVLWKRMEERELLVGDPSDLIETMDNITANLKEKFFAQLALSEDEKELALTEQEKIEQSFMKKRERFSKKGVFDECTSFDEIAFVLFRNFRENGLSDSRGGAQLATDCWQWVQTIKADCEEGLNKRWKIRAKNKILDNYCNHNPQQRVLTKNQGFRNAVGRAVEDFFSREKPALQTHH